MSPGGVHATRVRFNDFTIDVTSNDPRLVARLSTYYRGFPGNDNHGAKPTLTLSAVMGTEAPPNVALVPWGTKGKESYADVSGRRLIRKDRTGSLIVLDGRRWRITGDLQREFSQLLNVICSAYGVWLLEQGAGAMFHASAAVRNGKAIGIVGQSGAGKSSVTVRLLEHGFDFLTNDRLIIDARRGKITAHGLPKLPRVNPGTLLASERTRLVVDETSRKAYERMKPGELWKLEEKRDLDVGKTLQRGWLLSAPLACALVLDWGRDGPPALQRLSPDAAVDAFRATAKSFGPFDRKLSTRSDNALLEMVRVVPVYRVSGRIDPSALAAEIARRGLDELSGRPSTKRNAPRPSAGAKRRSAR